jgi:hypothetical protein
MSSTQTYYFKPLSDIYKFAFRDPVLKKFVYYNMEKLKFWNVQGHNLLEKNYPLKVSPVKELNDYEYTGFYYYEIEFRKRDKKIDFYATQGSA